MKPRTLVLLLTAAVAGCSGSAPPDVSIPAQESAAKEESDTVTQVNRSTHDKSPSATEELADSGAVLTGTPEANTDQSTAREAGGTDEATDGQAATSNVAQSASDSKADKKPEIPAETEFIEE